EALELRGLRDVPDGFGLERRLGQVERHGLERRLVADSLLLVRDDLLGDGDAAEGELEAEPALGAQRLLDLRRRLLLRLRVPVAGERVDDGGAGHEVELLDEVRLADVKVDRALVEGLVREASLDEDEQRTGSGVV